MSPLHDHPVRLMVCRYWTGRPGSLYQRTVRVKDGSTLLLGDLPTAQRVAEILTGRTGIVHMVQETNP